LSLSGVGPGEECRVPRTRPPYPPEFRLEATRLLRRGDRTIPEVARELGVSEQTLRNWRRQDAVDAGEEPGLTSDEQEELRRLRRENVRLREEKEILRKAAAFFARESEGPR
jgi:transposase